MRHWVNPYTGIFVNLSVYFVVTVSKFVYIRYLPILGSRLILKRLIQLCFIYLQFHLFIVASTLPVPSGNFVPVFKMGAAMGRLIGELMHLWFPYGINFSGDRWPVVPGISHY